MKKALLISLIAPALVIVLRIIEIGKKFSMLGLHGTYPCASLSIDSPCPLFDYIIKSDDAFITYVKMAMSFVALLALTSYMLLLIKLYKNNKQTLFWIVIGITILIALAYPFVV